MLSKPQATLRIGLHCGVPSFLRLGLQFLLSDARWSDWLATATELAGGAVVPGPTLKFAISLSLEERLFGQGRACAEPSFSYSRPSPPLSVFSALGAGKALGPRARVAPRTRAGRPPRVDGLRPLPCALPPGSSRPPLPPYPRALGLPLPRAGDLQPHGPGAIFDVSWVGGGRLGAVESQIPECSFYLSLANALFSPFCPFRAVPTPRLSPPISPFCSHPDSCFPYSETSRLLAPGSQVSSSGDWWIV